MHSMIVQLREVYSEASLGTCHECVLRGLSAPGCVVQKSAKQAAAILTRATSRALFEGYAVNDVYMYWESFFGVIKSHRSTFELQSRLLITAVGAAVFDRVDSWQT